MSTLQEIVPGIWSWSQFDEERQIHFNGHYLVRRGEAVIIDPAALDESGLNQLKALVSRHAEAPLKAILLTNVHHERVSAEWKRVFSVPVYIHEQDAGQLEVSPDATFQDGQSLFCGLQVVHFPDQKSPGESGFLLADEKILVVGDALIGRVPGKVNLLPPDKFADIDRAKAGLRRLQELEFDVLLVGDGHSIVGRAQAAVAEFLAGG